MKENEKKICEIYTGHGQYVRTSRKFLYIATIALLFVSLTSFQIIRRSDIAVRFVNINECCDSLKLEFKITCPKTGAGNNFSNVEIFKNDSLYLRLVADSVGCLTDFWTFPSIPNGYRIVYSEFTNNMPPFKKTDRLEFVFRSFNAYLGSWEYKPFYANEKAKWLFDELGNQKTTICAEYIPTLFRKDVISIRKSEDFSVEGTKFQILDEKNNPLEFKVKRRKRHQANVVELRLKKNEPKGSRLKLSANFGKEKYYEEKIIVPNKSSIRICC